MAPEHFVLRGLREAFGRASFYADEGKPYCKPCYVKHIGPCCAVNGHHRERRYLVKDGLRYCERTTGSVFGVRCAIGEEILRQGHVVNVWARGVLLAAHSQGLPFRDSCGRPIYARSRGRTSPISDGHEVCNRCGASPLMMSRPANPVAEVRKVMAGAGLDTGERPSRWRWRSARRGRRRGRPRAQCDRPHDVQHGHPGWRRGRARTLRSPCCAGLRTSSSRGSSLTS